MKIFIIDKYVAKVLSKVFKGKLGILVHLILMYFVYSTISNKLFQLFSYLSNYVFDKKTVTNIIAQINNPATFSKGLGNPLMIVSLVIYFGLTGFFTFLWLGGIIANHKQYAKKKKAANPA